MKPSKPKRRKSIVLRLAMLAFAIYMIVSMSQLQIQLVEEKSRLSELNKEYDAVVLKNQQLAALLENGTESEFIERAARDRLGYVYSNEEVYTDISGK